MINKKLLEFQKRNITLVKDANNPYYSSKYVPLNQVLGKVTKLLNDEGILILNESTKEGLKTILHDTEDGTFVESLFPYVETNTAQKVGGSMTYGRRYSLVALLSLEDEDDDGNRASGQVHPTVNKIKSGQNFTADEYEEAVGYSPDEAYGAVREANKAYREANPPVKRNPGVQYGKKATSDRLKEAGVPIIQQNDEL